MSRKHHLFLLSILVVLFSLQGRSQCVRIESILVDACTLGGSCASAGTDPCSCEGKNEMLRFGVGDSDLLVDNLQISWPNNSFQGFCQNASTAQHIDALNATISGCGWLVEPSEGILPAGSDVLVITSEDMCTASNSFEGLADTLIVLFQCAGNFQGHFANYGNGLRTTTISFGGGCSSSVTYDRSQLVTQGGLVGGEDGARVNFDEQGNPTYLNYGCAAPFEPLLLEAGEDQIACVGFPLTLEPLIQGAFSEVSWSGGNGEFEVDENGTLTYTPGLTDPEIFVLTLTASTCEEALTDALTVTLVDAPEASVSSEPAEDWCEGQALVLFGEGNGDLTWSTGETGASITVLAGGDYILQVSNGCGTAEASITLEAQPAPEVAIFPDGPLELCPDESVELIGSGVGNPLWSNGADTEAINVSEAAIYTLTYSNACGSAVAFVEVLEGTLPIADIMPDVLPALCEGDELELTANAEEGVLWSTGEVTSSIVIDQAGVYSLTVSNACGSDVFEFTVEDGGSAPFIIADDENPSEACAGEEVTLSAESSAPLNWSTGESGSSVVVTAGTYTVSASNACGSSSLELLVDLLPSAELTLLGESELVICPDDLLVLAAEGDNLSWPDGSNGPTYLVDAAGAYEVTATNACGTVTAIFTVIEAEVNGAFSATPPFVLPPAEVLFESLDPELTGHTWFVDGTEAGNDPNLTFSFEEAGVYVIELFVTDANGCSGGSSMSFEVGACELAPVLPNVFSPNEDGVNDRYTFATDCLVNPRLLVYNRWGNIVLEREVNVGAWSGRDSNGEALHEGVYYLVLEYETLLGESKTQTAHVHLVR